MADLDNAKLAKLPQWAQGCIRDLQAELTRTLDDLEDARARLADLPSEGVSDTMLAADDTAGVLPDRPLPSGATIVFDRTYDVRIGTAEDVPQNLRGHRMLFVSAWQGLAVVPLDMDRVAVVVTEKFSGDNGGAAQ
jgi:hypothetical protein